MEWDGACPLGVLRGAFLAMAVPVRDPFSVDRAVLNREMGWDAVAQVFQNAIAAVWIRTGFRLHHLPVLAP